MVREGIIVPNGEPGGQSKVPTEVGEATRGAVSGPVDAQLEKDLGTPGFLRTAEQRVRIAAHEKALTTPPVEPAEPSLGDLARQAQAEVGGEELPPTVPAETLLGQPPITAEPTAGIGEEVGGEAVGREEKETAEGEKGITAEDWTAAERETGGSKEEPVGGQEGTVAPEEAAAPPPAGEVAGEVADEREVLQQDLMNQARQALTSGNFDDIRETVRKLAQESEERRWDVDEVLGRILQDLKNEGIPDEQYQRLEEEAGFAIDEGVDARRAAQRGAKEPAVAPEEVGTGEGLEEREAAYVRGIEEARERELEEVRKSRPTVGGEVEDRLPFRQITKEEFEKLQATLRQIGEEAAKQSMDPLLAKEKISLVAGRAGAEALKQGATIEQMIAAQIMAAQAAAKDPSRTEEAEEAAVKEGIERALRGEVPPTVEEAEGVSPEPVVPSAGQEGTAVPPPVPEAVRVPAEAAIAPERRPFAKKLVNALKTGVTNWVKNIDPRGKDKTWMAGAAVGAVESAVVIWAAPIPGVSGLVKSGLNLAAAQGVFGVARWGKMREGFGIRQQYSGEELVSKLAEHEEKYAKATGRIRNFFLGVSAGATYVSLTGLGIEGAKEVTKGMEISLPQVSIPRAPDIGGGIKGFFDRFRGGAPAGAETPTLPPTEAAAAGVPPTGIPPPEETVLAGISPEAKAAFDTITNNPEYLTQKAAWVGRELPISDKVIEDTLARSGKSLSELDPVTLEKAKLAIQHAMENQANKLFDANLEQLVQTDPTVDLAAIVEASHQAGADWLTDPTAQLQLSEVAQKAITDQLAATDVLVDKVTAGLEADSSFFTDKVITSGTTVGQMLHEAGYQVSWTGADAKMFGAHILANYDMLTDMWDKMADNRLIPQSPFPVSPFEINDLVAKAEAGDKEALRRLVQALHWIPAGARLRILTTAGLDKALALAA